LPAQLASLPRGSLTTKTHAKLRFASFIHKEGGSRIASPAGESSRGSSQRKRINWIENCQPCWRVFPGEALQPKPMQSFALLVFFIRFGFKASFAPANKKTHCCRSGF